MTSATVLFPFGKQIKQITTIRETENICHLLKQQYKTLEKKKSKQTYFFSTPFVLNTKSDHLLGPHSLIAFRKRSQSRSFS